MTVPTTRVRQLLIACLLVLAGVGIGRYALPVTPVYDDPRDFIATAEGERYLVFPTFWEAWDTLHEKFIGTVEDPKLFYGAVAGMVRATGDPYTDFADPAHTKQFEDTIAGSFSGIGVEIGIRGGLITVIAPLAGSPAEAAGVREGDVIIAVDKEPLAQDLTLDDVVSKIRGPRRSEVKLTVVRGDEPKPLDFTIVRDRIAIESVRTTFEEEMARIAVTSFNNDTPARFTSAAREVTEHGTRGVILDLRNNPGGFLQAAVDVTSHLLAPGTLIVSERGRETTEYKADGPAILMDIPLVVLVNNGSASASEIVAGALRDHGRAKVIGTKTFGKGSVQEFVKLADNSSLRVTVANWYTPDGTNIDEEGIGPDIEVEQDYDTDADEPLVRAREELRVLIGQ